MSRTDLRSSARDRPRGAHRPRLIATTIVLVLGIGIGAYWFFSQGPGNQLVSPAGSDVAAFSGEGDQTTGSFQVRGQWAIHWENTGDRFAFAIAGEHDLGTIIEQEDAGSGVTTVVAAGTFHLEIEADGPWAVRVTQGD